jgi:hypothetical protein
VLLKAILAVAGVVAFAGLIAVYWAEFRPARTARALPPAELKCTLDADELDGRRARLASLVARARETVPLADGYAIRSGFDRQAILDWAELLADESQCCVFFNYRLTARPSDDLLLVEVTGPPGAKELLARNMPSAGMNATVGESRKGAESACPAACAPESCRRGAPSKEGP